MTRNQRRSLARKRKDAKAELLKRRALHVLQSEKAKANLSGSRSAYRNPKTGKIERVGRTPTGMIASIYSGAANPVGYTRPLRYTKGVAK